MIGIDVGAIYRSVAYDIQRQQLEHARYRQVLEVTSQCGLDLRKLERVMIGVDAQRHFAAVLVGDAAGDLEKLTCLSKSTAERAAIVPEFAVEAVGEGVHTLVAKKRQATTSIHRAGETRVEGDGTFERFVGVRVDERTLVLCSEAWKTAVLDLAAGKGRPAVDHSLAATYRDSSKTQHVWFGGKMPNRLPVPAGGDGGHVEGLQAIRGGIDLADGLALHLVAEFDSVPHAQSAEMTMTSALGWAKSMRAMLGLPKSLVEGVGVVRNSAALEIEISVSVAELELVRKTLSRISGQGRGAPALPGSQRGSLEPLPTRWPINSEPSAPN